MGDMFKEVNFMLEFRVPYALLSTMFEGIPLEIGNDVNRIIYYHYWASKFDKVSHEHPSRKSCGCFLGQEGLSTLDSVTHCITSCINIIP